MKTFQLLGWALILSFGAVIGCASAQSSATATKPSEAAPAMTSPGAGEAGQGAAAEDQSAATAAAEKANAANDASASAAASGEEAEAKAGAKPAAEQEHEWLTDDNGKQYYVQRFPKRRGQYEVLGEHRIVYQGVPMAIDHQDDDWFYVKVYRSDGAKTYKAGHPKPTPEEKEKVAATYRFDTPSADRLKLEPFDRGLPKRGQWRNGFDIADMDEDGHLDIVHGSPRKGPGIPVIFRGDGKGDWKSWLTLKFPKRYDYGDVAVADFNGDGHEDLALGIHLQGVQALIHDGKGGFTDWSGGLDYEVAGGGGKPSEFSSRAITTGDWNGDGRPDIIALGEGPHPPDPNKPRRKTTKKLFIIPGPTLYINQGDGTWKKRTQNKTDAEIFGDSLATGDFDADGKLDFATSSNMMLRTDLVDLHGKGGGWTPQSVAGVRPGYVRAVTAADFDGNGRDDLAVAYISYQLEQWRNGVDIFYSQDDGTWIRRPLFSREGRTALYTLDHGDVDGDGALDLVSFDADGEGFLWLGDGHGFFVRETSPELVPPSPRCRGYHARLVDLDGDGRAEIVADFAGESNALLDVARCPSGGGISVWRAEPGKSTSQGAGGES